ncbi:hypothetical protein LX16_3496 [Stackebrandtia albiflava]|uniref:Uncharacterized protein n=1 Tax=Stackebrandtia albiflava TaxID=406432 RepID=A0A562V4H4_9ACTN|nr:hypothetical protein LX16_3496 [Stackebrandtia albiflava]
MRDRIRGFARSSGDYLDLIVACGMAFVVAAVSLLDVFGGDEFINEAILLVLGFYALAVIRDRRGRQKALEDASALRCLDDAAVDRVLTEERDHTTHWAHRDGTGSLLRRRLLPRLAAEGGRRGGAFGLQVELADPMDTGLCERYAAQFRSGGENDWRAADVRDEILVTIVALFYLGLRTTVRPRVAVSRNLSMFTVDLTDRAVSVDPLPRGAQSLLVSGSLSHFRGWQYDLAASYSHGRELPLEQSRHRVEEPDVVDIDELNAVLVDLAVLPDDYRRADLSRLAAAVTAALPARDGRN